MTDIIRSEPPKPSNVNQGEMKPSDYIPDMAAAKMAADFVNKMGPFTNVSKAFIVRQGIWTGLNHGPKNKTGYDCSMRISIYTAVANHSGNVDGFNLKSFWQYLMRPSYVITQMGGLGGQPFSQEEPGFFRRILNRLTGGGQQPQVQQQQG
jgi:hypothetical protein